MPEYIEAWDRAISFLRDRNHAAGQADGARVIIDSRTYMLREVPTLAARLYPTEWIASESAYLAAHLSEPK